MGWIQVIRHHAERGDEETVLVDTAPQLADTQSPYFSWGIRPEFFDAPSTTQRDIVWTADAFLVASPDALMSKHVRPVCGFRWGYTTKGKQPELLPIAPVEAAAWSSACFALSARYNSWHFDPTWADER